MTKRKKYKCFNDLPNRIKAILKECPPWNVETFIKRKIPVMNNKSIIDILNTCDDDSVQNEIISVIKRGYYK